MKESLARIVAWARAHPLYAVLIVGGVALVAYLVYRSSPKLQSITSNATGDSGTDEGTLTGGYGEGTEVTDAPLPDYIYPYNDPSYYTGGGNVTESVPSSGQALSTYYATETAIISNPTLPSPAGSQFNDTKRETASSVNTLESGRRSTAPGSSAPNYGATPAHRSAASLESIQNSVIQIRSGSTSSRRDPVPPSRSGSAATSGPTPRSTPVRTPTVRRE